MLNFEYKIIDNYIVIEKYIGEEIIVEIPSLIENLPVTHIGHSAFRGQNKIIDIKLPETLKAVGDYAFCDCRGLTEIHLPNSVIAAGNHSFYNCRHLEKVSIPSGLKTVGDGFIKNCDDIKTINLDSGKNLQVGVVAFFNELKQEITLNIENENISLIFPYYDYEYVVNAPARVCSSVTIGSGFKYRQALSTKGINFNLYDEAFLKAQIEERAETVLKLAITRLLYPVGLKEESKEKYRKYLIENVDKAILFCEEQSHLEMLDKEGIFVKENIDMAVEAAAKTENSQISAFILDIKLKNFGKTKKTFEL